MYRNRKPLHVDLIVFVVCCLLGSFYLGFEVGRVNQPKVCAEVKGLRPISSTADECTYIMAKGLAYWRKKI